METLNETELCFPTLNKSCRRTPQPELETTIIYILLSVIIVVTVVLNLLVIISIAHFRQLHTCTNFLLLSLAVADFLIGLLPMPLQSFYYRGCWLLGNIPCAVHIISGYFLVGVSCLNMTLISFDRYTAICEPMQYHTRVTIPRVQACICLCWFSCFVHINWILRDFVKNLDIYNSCVGQCVLVLVHPVEGIVGILFFLAVPFTVITVLYLGVFTVAVSQARAIRSQITSVALQTSGAKAKKMELKAAKTLGVLVIVFIICSSPYYAFTLTAENGKIDLLSGSVEVWLIFFNSCMNPIIYAMCYPWYRRSIKHIITLQILKPGSRDINILLDL
ncbi:trace amine-associated receptor 4-like [Eucyclogobius newberryi]|uniref:trace amine-associated receptor 4-like n=1 Tax=Eucyclogobius newberryi TaxID=166745 RepID=UPI003B595820